MGCLNAPSIGIILVAENDSGKVPQAGSYQNTYSVCYKILLGHCPFDLLHCCICR